MYIYYYYYYYSTSETEMIMLHNRWCQFFASVYCFVRACITRYDEDDIRMCAARRFTLTIYFPGTCAQCIRPPLKPIQRTRFQTLNYYFLSSVRGGPTLFAAITSTRYIYICGVSTRFSILSPYNIYLYELVEFG